MSESWSGTGWTSATPAPGADPADDEPTEPGSDDRPDEGRPDEGRPDEGWPVGGARFRRRLRTGTIVLGLLLGVVAVTVWCAAVLDLSVSVGAVVAAALVGAGVLLLAGAVLSPGRDRSAR